MEKIINTGDRAAPRRQWPITDFHDEMYVARKGVKNDVQRGRGRRFIRWTFDRRMGKNHSFSIMEKFKT